MREDFSRASVSERALAEDVSLSTFGRTRFWSFGSEGATRDATFLGAGSEAAATGSDLGGVVA
jgi:hypothetical protein